MPKLAQQRAGVEGASELGASVSASPKDFIAAPRGRWWRDASRRRFLALADVCAAAVATTLVTVPATGTFWALLFLPLWLLIAKLFGLYDRDHRALRHLTADEVPSILAWVGVTSALVIPLLALTPADAVELGNGDRPVRRRGDHGDRLPLPDPLALVEADPAGARRTGRRRPRPGIAAAQVPDVQGDASRARRRQRHRAASRRRAARRGDCGRSPTASTGSSSPPAGWRPT